MLKRLFAMLHWFRDRALATKDHLENLLGFADRHSIPNPQPTTIEPVSSPVAR